METETIRSFWNQGMKTMHGIAVAGDDAIDAAWRQHIDRMESSTEAACAWLRAGSESARQGRKAILSAWEGVIAAWSRAIPETK